MAQIRRLAELGLGARAKSGIDPGRILRRALVARLPGVGRGPDDLSLFSDLLANALQVVQVQFVEDIEPEIEWQILFSQERSRRADDAAQEISAVLVELAPEAALEMASQFWQGLSVGVESGDRPFTLLPAEVEVRARTRPGWEAATGSGFVVALDLEESDLPKSAT
jgi:hypothetical protein